MGRWEWGNEPLIGNTLLQQFQGTGTVACVGCKEEPACGPPGFCGLPQPGASYSCGSQAPPIAGLTARTTTIPISQAATCMAAHLANPDPASRVTHPVLAVTRGCACHQPLGPQRRKQNYHKMAGRLAATARGPSRPPRRAAWLAGPACRHGRPRWPPWPPQSGHLQKTQE